MSPVHAAAFLLCVFLGSLEARVRHISWGSLMGVRLQSVQGQGRAPKACILRDKVLTRG